MNIVLNPIGSHGDVHPFVGIGLELQRRGHDVTLVTNAHFGPLVQSAGLNFEPLGDDARYRNLMADPNLWHPTRGPRVAVQGGALANLQETVDLLRRLTSRDDSVLVASSLGFGARIVREITDVPTVTVHLAPMVFRSVIAPPVLGGMIWPRNHTLRRAVIWLADVGVIDPMMAGPINRLRATYGLPPARRLLKDWWNSPDRVLGLFPDWYAPPQADWPQQVRLTGFPMYDERGVTPLSPALDQFLNTGGAPIAFTPGTAMLHGQDFFRAAVGACAVLDRRGLLLTRHREQLPADLPAGVIHVDYAPFSQLLPRCAAIVHHGGIGTTSQALAAGIPQIVMPMSHDQPDNAARLARLGVGASLKPKKFTATNLATILGRLLGDSAVAAQAREIATRFADNRGIERAADWIEAARAAHHSQPAKVVA
ncbi:MAG TPA: nucleotide disphospho-sugar-binding domain-containing protein [Tepidisphaeraceae bacterium]|jgi:rhamnosyltransferase subunit B|nr:nucleotide disphospho-sugar-binding domain-containing protein [Tepidisphaeraceae bacterium]